MPMEDIACIEAIAKIVNDLDLESVDYNKDGLHIIVNNRAKETIVSTVATQSAVVAAPTSVPAVEQNAPVIPAKATNGKEVKSPMVGVLYLSPSPEEANYVKVGDIVKEGDVLCLIEAMKTFNQIKAPFGGIIREILVESGSAVEFDEPLFVIE